jgi:hypothetical protein
VRDGRQLYDSIAANCSIRLSISLERARILQSIIKRHRVSGLGQDGRIQETIRRVLESLGWTWTPTMAIGSGCIVHLRDGELPRGRLIVSVSKHIVAVIDGVIHDTHDPSRDGTRCVYGYWRKHERLLGSF